jgi:hypothetical protein
MNPAGTNLPRLHLRSPNKPDFGHCLINALAQKGWALQVPICLTYLEVEGDLSQSTQIATAKILPVRWPHPLRSAESLPSYRVLNLQEEYIKTGRCDKNLLYDSAQLISFPSTKLDNDRNATIHLFRNKEETIQIEITIPPDFPDYLLAKPIFVEIFSRLEHFGSEASLTLCIMVIG